MFRWGCSALVVLGAWGCSSGSGSGTGAGGSSASGGAGGGASGVGAQGSGGAPGSGGASGSGGAAGNGSGGASGGAGGSAGAGGTSGTGGGSGSGGNSGGGGSSSCAPTQDTIECGGASCDVKSQVCCGGTQGGKCFAPGQFCGLGGILRMRCDDPSDCPAGEICCPAPVANSGSDAPYETLCMKPKSAADGGNLFGCGTTPGNFAWPRLCSCDADCPAGTHCTSGDLLVPGISGVRRCG